MVTEMLQSSLEIFSVSTVVASSGASSHLSLNNGARKDRRQMDN